MIATQLEGIVLRTVGSLRAGNSQEDDRVELKREWPGIDKARQLAASANQSRGDDLIYIIGLDELGEIHRTGTVDPAAWWSNMESAFDEVAPELERHLTIQISDTESVVALQFRTDRTPYVVKVLNGGASEREVPIRTATRTRSANRHELLQLLLPAVEVPSAQVLTANAYLGPPGYASAESDSIVLMQASFEVYFEPATQATTFLPKHDAKIELLVGEELYQSSISYTVYADPQTYGIRGREDGLEVLGPGSHTLNGQWVMPKDRVDELGSHDEWTFRVTLPVASSEKAVLLSFDVGGRELPVRRSAVHSGLPEPTYRCPEMVAADHVALTQTNGPRVGPAAASSSPVICVRIARL